MSHLDWHVGMKVVCVDDDFCWSTGVSPYPAKGTVHEIIGMELEPAGTRHGEWVSTVDIFYIELAAFGRNVGFDADHFRPVQTRKTDISIFTAMLTGSRQGVSA